MLPSDFKKYLNISLDDIEPLTERANRIFIPLLKAGAEKDIQNILQSYVDAKNFGLTLSFYMPEEIYDLDWFEKQVEFFSHKNPTDQELDIELFIDPFTDKELGALIQNSHTMCLLHEDGPFLFASLIMGTRIALFYSPSDLIKTIQANGANIFFASPDTMVQCFLAPKKRDRQGYGKKEVTRIYFSSIFQNPISLIYTPSLHHLKSLKADISTVILTDDFDVFCKCEDVLWPCLLLQDYLDQSYLSSMDFQDQGNQLARSWFKDLMPLTYKASNILENMQYDMWHVLRASLKIKEAFDHIEEQYSIEKLILFDEFKRPQYWDPAFGPFPDAKNAVLLFLAESASIPCEILAAPQYGWLRTQLPSQAAEQTQGGELFTPLSEILNLKAEYQSVVVAIGSHLDLAEQGEVASELWQKPEVLYVFLRTYIFPVKLKNAIFLDLSFFVESPFFAEDMRTLKQDIERFQNAFQTGEFQAAKDYPFIFRNKHLMFQFQDFFAQIIEGAKYINAARWIDDLLKPDLYLLGNNASGTMKNFLRNLPRERTFGKFHGSAQNLTPQNVPPVKHLFLKGDSSKRQLKRRMTPKENVWEKISTIGDMRILSNQPMPPDVQKLYERLRTSINGRPVITLFTVQIDYGLYWGSHRLREHSEYWRGIEQIIQNHPEWCFLIRHHPRYDYLNLYYDLSKKHDNLFLVDSAFIFDHIKDLTDISVVVNAFSSVLYEIYRAQKPLVMLVNEKLEASRDKLLLAFPLTVNTIPELEHKLEEMVKDHFDQSELLAKQTRFLEDECGLSSEQGSQEFLAYVEEMLSDNFSTGRNKQEIKDMLLLNLAFEATRIYREPRIWSQVNSHLSGSVDTKVVTHYQQKLSNG